MKLAACIALLCALFTGLQKAGAQDLSECIAAGRVAVVVTTAVNEGTPIDRVQVGFPKAPPQMEAQNQAFVAKIKQVLAALLLKETMPQPYTQEARDFANHMGLEVAKQCAFDIGALRRADLARNLGRDLAELHELVMTASSEHIRTGSIDMMCRAKKDAAYWAIGMILRGIQQEDFLNLFPLPENWSQDMKDWAVKMLKDAYKWPRGAEDFANWIYNECLEGR